MDLFRALLRVFAAGVRRGAIRIALALVDRLDTEEMTRAGRVWLEGDVEEDLATQIDDAERRSISAKGARTMLVTRSVLDWLEGDRPPASRASALESVSPAPQLPRTTARQTRTIAPAVPTRRCLAATSTSAILVPVLSSDALTDVREPRIPKAVFGGRELTLGFRVRAPVTTASISAERLTIVAANALLAARPSGVALS